MSTPKSVTQPQSFVSHAKEFSFHMRALNNAMRIITPALKNKISPCRDVKKKISNRNVNFDKTRPDQTRQDKTKED